MIEQDPYWRAELNKISDRLKRRYEQRKWTKRTLFEIEKDIFLSAYIIRKLIESGRVGHSVLGLSVCLKKYPIRPGALPPATPQTFLSAYDVYDGRDKLLSIKGLCNQFVHSFIFSPLIISRDHGVVFGIYFASDSESKTGLYYIPLVKMIEIIASAARNRPIKLKLQKTADGAFDVK
jgi:hypothetical protein